MAVGESSASAIIAALVNGRPVVSEPPSGARNTSGASEFSSGEALTGCAWVAIRSPKMRSGETLRVNVAL